MDRFSKYHPGVILSYFILILCINIILFDPVLLAVFLGSQVILYIYLKGLRDNFSFFLGGAMLVVFCIATNMLLNHRGMSVIAYIGDLPVTVEAFAYGLKNGILILGMCFMFSSFSQMMTSEKIMALFGARFPAVSLVFSMALGFIPRIKADMKKIMVNKVSPYDVVSTISTIAIEGSMETGIAMRDRGYGKGRRTSICRRKFRSRDWIVLAVIFAMGCLFVGIYKASGTYMQIFPYLEYGYNSMSVWAYVIYFLLLNLVFIIDIGDEIRWSIIHSRI